MFRQRADAAVQIDHRPAENRVRLVIAQPSQREHGPPPRHAFAVQGEPLERADEIAFGGESQELRDVVVVEILLEEID